MKNSIIAIGHNENVYIFNSVGVEGIVASEETFETILLDKIKKNVKIIIVSQKFEKLLEEFKKEYSETYPIFITLVMELGVESNGINKLKENVEKATGINLI